MIASMFVFLSAFAAQKIEIPDWENAVKFELVASQDKARPGDALQLAVVTRVLPGYHIYGPAEKKPSRTEIHPQPLEGLTFGAPVFPPVVTRELEGLGKYDLYEGTAAFRVPLTVTPTYAVASSYKVQVKVNYQICTDIACSAPNSKVLSIEIPAAAKGAPVRPVRPEVFGKSGGL